MKTMYEFAPGRFVLPTGERVRVELACPDLLLADFDVLTRAESYAAELATLRLAVRRGHIHSDDDAVCSDDDMAKRRSGPSGKPWTEEQYREAGIELLHLRMRPEVHAPLDELAATWGFEGRTARADAIRRAIAEAHARHVAPYAARRGAEQPPDESTVLTKPPLNTRARRQKTDKSEG